MWEICKSAADAAKEFDRTMDFIAGTLKEYKAMLKADNAFVQMDREPRSGISPHISPYLEPRSGTRTYLPQRAPERTRVHCIPLYSYPLSSRGALNTLRNTVFPP